MAEGFKALFDDLKAGRDVREAQDGLYRLVSSALLEPLRAKIPAKARTRLDAEDVLHDAFLRALKNIDRADAKTERQFLAWIYRIARNLMSDQAKRMSAQAVPFATETSSGGGVSAPRASRVPGREGSVESSLQRKETLERAFSQMREPEAEVIRRRWLAGQSFAEIATALRKTQKAVKGLYTRAWKRFQDRARKDAR